MDQTQQNRIIEYAREELPSVLDYDHPVIFQQMQYFYYEGVAWVFNALLPLPDGLEAKDVYYATVVFRKEVVAGLEVGWEYVKII